MTGRAGRAGVPYDYVVVGAGAAGCVVAHRLSADPEVRVLLVEAGGTSRHPMLRVPKAFVRTMLDPRFAWHYPAAVAGSTGEETWIRGRGLGGSTAINGMLYLRHEPRGDAVDPGVPGWQPADVLGAYRALESPSSAGRRLGRAAGSRRGRVRPDQLTVTLPTSRDPVLQAVAAAAAELGVATVPDVNAASGPRLGAAPSTIRRGRRVGAADVLQAAAGRPNLTVLTATRATRLVLADTAGGQPQVVGVDVERRWGATTLHATREVVLAAGALETPLLLQRSGIGDPQRLAAAGITPRVRSPLVGARLTEQRLVTVSARLRPGLGLGPALSSRAGVARAAGRYLTTRSGPLATGPYELTGALDVDGSGHTSAQLLVTALATDESGLRVAAYPGLTVQGYQLRPSSHGRVDASGPGLDDPPRIVARFLDTAADRRVAHALVKWQRALLRTPPLADLVVAETRPGPHLSDPDEVVAHVRRAGSGIYHAVGSCAAGDDPDDVVDRSLRVRGIDGLRVVDASVFPSHPGGATAAPTMALGWWAGGLILAGR